MILITLSLFHCSFFHHIWQTLAANRTSHTTCHLLLFNTYLLMWKAHPSRCPNFICCPFTSTYTFLDIFHIVSYLILFNIFTRVFWSIISYLYFCITLLIMVELLKPPIRLNKKSHMLLLVNFKIGFLMRFHVLSLRTYHTNLL